MSNTRPLEGRKIAILATEGFEQVELTEPKKALEAAGAQTDVISPKGGTIRGWDMVNWGENVPVDVTLGEATPSGYDALLLPGGVMNPDSLRTNEQALEFIRSFVSEGKPIASICHGPWTLVEINAVRGRRLTSWPSLQTDIRNAGGEWVDEEVVNDNGLITSRNPDDLPAFNRAIVEEFSKSTPATSDATTSS